jgi:cytochrome c
MTFATPTRRIAAAALAALGAALAASAVQAQPAAPPASFGVCAACHESTANARPSLGPNLFGVGGRKAGSVPDYDYSPAMKASTTIWTADTLAPFIQDPSKAIPGNKMDYDGSDAETAKAIAAYLMTLKP